MNWIQNLTILLTSSTFLYLLFTVIKFLHRIWWTPLRIQYSMKSQGITGPPYRFFYGNTKEVFKMKQDSMSTAMDDLSHDIVPRILPHMHSWVHSYGMNFLNWCGPKPELVVTEPDLVREILNNRDDEYPKIDIEGYAKKLLGDGLSTSKGEKWAKLRKLANHAFHSESLKRMIPMMVTSAEIMLERWKEHQGKEMEVFAEFRLLASDIISKTAFGSSYMEGKSIFEMLMKLTILFSRNAHKIRLQAISKFVRSSDDVESEKLEQGIKECIIEIIKKRGQEKGGEVVSSTTDFLGKLLEASMSIEDIVDECKTFYFAGHETTTSMLGWTIFLLAIHKDWQEKARKEVVELFGQRAPNSDGIARMKLMNMIIEESLRLYPPVPVIKRKVEKEVKLGKLTLPPHMELYISPLALHHDLRMWGEGVHMFRPERFAEGVAKATNNTAAAYMPFGFGPRTCVGLHFAITEAKIALSMILQRYEFTLSPTHIHSPIQLFMLRPQHGVKIILHPV